MKPGRIKGSDPHMTGNRIPAFQKNHFYPLFFLAIAFVLYGNTIPNHYSLDDPLVIQDNQKVQLGIKGIPLILRSPYYEEEGNTYGYRPVVQITFVLEYEIWGENPHLSHLVNVLLYALILILLFSLLRKLLKKYNLLFPFLITLLFAAHPIHTEVVASLKNRETLMSFLFCLATLDLILRFFEQKKIRHLAGGAIFFILAYFSKQDAISFILILPLTLYFFTDIRIRWMVNASSLGKRVTGSMAGTIKKWYLVILAAFFYILTYWIYIRGAPWLLLPCYFTALGLLVFHYILHRRTGTNDAVALLKSPFVYAGLACILISILFTLFWPAYLAILLFAFFLLGKGRKKEAEGEKQPLTSSFSSALYISPGFLKLLIILGLFIFIGILVYKLPGLFLPEMKKELYRFENPLFVWDPAFQKTGLVFQTLLFYLKKLVWPYPFGFYYGYNMIPLTNLSNPWVVFSLLFHLGIFIYALIRLPQKHILSYAILLYLVAVSVFSNWFISIPGIVAERLAFFPSLGFCIAITWLIFFLFRADPLKESLPANSKTGILLLGIFISVGYGILDFRRNRDWKDEMTLFSRDIGYLRNSAKANELFASRLMQQAFPKLSAGTAGPGDSVTAIRAMDHLQQALSIDPTYKYAWNNLGMLYFNLLGNSGKAVESFRNAVRIDPSYAKAQYNLGHVLAASGNPDAALIHYQLAVKSDTTFIPPRLELAEIMFKRGEVITAQRLNEEIIRINPDLATPYINVGNYLLYKKDTAQAIVFWEKAFTRNPSNIVLCANLAGYFRHIQNKEKSEYYMNLLMKLKQLR